MRIRDEPDMRREDKNALAWVVVCDVSVHASEQARIKYAMPDKRDRLQM